MIHSPEARQRLAPLPEMTPRRTSWSELGVALGGCLLSGAFSMVWGLLTLPYRVLTAAGSPRPPAPPPPPQVDFTRAVVTGSKVETHGLVDLRMNPEALSGFARWLAYLFSFPESSPRMGVPGAKELDSGSVGWHTHPDLFFPDFPVDLTLGLGDGPMIVLAGTHLSASREEWLRIAATWLAVAEEGHPCLLVLDRDQEGWCSAESTGRLLIELSPLTQPTSRR